MIYAQGNAVQHVLASTTQASKQPQLLWRLQAPSLDVPFQEDSYFLRTILCYVRGWLGGVLVPTADVGDWLLSRLLLGHRLDVLYLPVLFSYCYRSS